MREREREREREHIYGSLALGFVIYVALVRQNSNKYGRQIYFYLV